MNLLIDDWIPVILNGGFQRLSLKQLLCDQKGQDWQLSCFRDDMELAALQLLICVVQVVFMPEDTKALQSRWAEPMPENDYEQGIALFRDWFDLLHPKTPFMQIRGLTTKETTPIQKLFIGLPEGNNHAFFNEVGEIKNAHFGDIAIALFNQNTNAPGFSGKQKAGLRCATPINTLIKGETLRKTVWLNVLHHKFINKLYPLANNKPVWIDPIVEVDQLEEYIKKTKSKENSKNRKKIYAHEIGFARGLFWLPVLIEIMENGSEFRLGSDFYFDINGVWPHPHTPRKWTFDNTDTNSPKKLESFLSFNTTSPAWTHLSSILIEADGRKGGHTPAPVISQFKQVFRRQPLNLIVGGYCNKQALILQRCHELFSLKSGWDSNLQHLNVIIDTGLSCNSILQKKLYGVGKEIGIKGLANQGVEKFYALSESLIHELLKTIEWDEANEQISAAKKSLITLSKKIFDSIVLAYEHDPKRLKVIVKMRADLSYELKGLIGEIE